MADNFADILTIVNDIIYATDDTPAVDTADRCVAVLDRAERNIFITALFAILTPAAWDAALDAAFDAGYDRWSWTESGRPTDTDYTWMICYQWATMWLRTRAGKQPVR